MKRPEMLNKRREDPFANVFTLLLVLLLLCALMLLLLFHRDYFIVQVQGSSMQTTLENGDFLYVDRTRAPERGDIVIADVTDYRQYAGTQHNADGRALIIKRLIALEGDTVKCEGHVLYVRRAGEEEFVPESDGRIRYPTPDFREITVGEGEAFLLGDHRDDSYDSQDVGCFRLTDLKGVVPEWVVQLKGLITRLEGMRFTFFEKS